MPNNNSGNRLIPLAELTFMPMVFYVLTQWDKIHTWQGIALWFMIFALVQNEYLSVRGSFPKYNPWLYLLDLSSLFIYVVGLEKLTTNDPVIGYDPKFWVVLSLLWLGYALWDFLMVPHEEDPQKKEQLKRWGITMILFFVITLLCGIGLSSVVAEQTLPNSNKYIIYILQLIPICFIFWSLFLWIKDLRSTFRDITN